MWSARRETPSGGDTVRCSAPFGLVKICAFSVCVVHHSKVERRHYNSSLSQSSFIEICVCNVAYKRADLNIQRHEAIAAHPHQAGARVRLRLQPVHRAGTARGHAWRWRWWRQRSPCCRRRCPAGRSRCAGAHYVQIR